jgi:hypothetical protein
MEIKGVYDLYAAQQQATAASAAHRVSSAATEKTGIAAAVEKKTSADTVNISTEGSFRSMLQQAEEPYAAAYAKQVPSAERIDQLKKDYSGNNCPVQAQQIAGAILTSVMGLEG